MARSNAEIELLKTTFQEKDGDDLVIQLKIFTSGGRLQRVCPHEREGCCGADALYKAGEGRMGTDEMAFINILVYKTDLVAAIKTEFSGDAKRALLFLVRSVLEPVELLAELFETTLKGASKDAYGLSAWAVPPACAHSHRVHASVPPGAAHAYPGRGERRVHHALDMRASCFCPCLTRLRWSSVLSASGSASASAAMSSTWCSHRHDFVSGGEDEHIVDSAVSTT
ncbi:hypothetical protein PHYPSEUDO_008290 [Phytophthora pseudosyringae]|uniref:Uncharacterized protein n=1 Tax=Phytophthora pseudosyringae TaxID=221518 RepID=A0A8T1VHH5_9STRA|nr:hypothetical protein PHYPSEUDO_008290 [Phytophthora pseudosyringae]